MFWAHIAEEIPGFVRWYNSFISPAISESDLVASNIQPLVITAVLALAAAFHRRKWTSFLLLVWLAYFMFANTLFHIAATIALGRYCPGLITAMALYLPYYFWYAQYLRSSFSVRLASVVIVSALATGIAYLVWHKALFKI